MMKSIDSQALQLFWLMMMIIMIMLPIGSDGKDDFLVNCGQESATARSVTGGRVWSSDDGASFSPPNINAVSYAAPSNSGGDPPYSTARIFNSTLKYSFPIAVPAGPKFLRLYFSSSATYNNTRSSQQFSLSLKANNITLLHNFSPSRNSISSCASDNPVYEFFLVLENSSTKKQTLDLSFSPGECSSGACLGFINGIEIVSAPDGLYINKTLNYVSVDNSGMNYYSMESTWAFQTAYRLNVGGSDIQPVKDAGDMSRAWYKDDHCIGGVTAGGTTFPSRADDSDPSGIKYSKIPEYTAPKIVYGTRRYIGVKSPEEREKMNLTWALKVDAGFAYLVRLHFCEMDTDVTKATDRVFQVKLNGMTAIKYIDVWEDGGERRGSPIYKDVVIRVDSNNNAGAHAPLVLALLPYMHSKLEDVLLSGLEVLKLNTPDGNLAVNYPPLSPVSTARNPDTPTSKSSFPAIIGGAVGGGAPLLLFGALVAYLILRHHRTANILSKASTTKPFAAGDDVSSLPSELCRRFSLAKIRVATSDFDEAAIIGTGAFGTVYKGSFDVSQGGGATTVTVAIKRLNPSSKQGAAEFRTEIEMLSRLRHLHLVSLIGYCDEQGEMILVYEYMPHGSLRDHLHHNRNNCNDLKKMNSPLSCKQRLSICLGASRGLHYLHTCAKQAIIHRDVKSSNILLDEKWTAKVSDFGLSRVGPASEMGVSHVSTAVKGSFGYMDPEYLKLQQLTEKSDVYSFGVVLFEVLCARSAVDPNLPKKEVNLAMWARTHYKSGTLHRIIDPNLKGQIATECLKKFGEIAEMCVRERRTERPSMGDVVGGLEFALQLQQTAEKNSGVNGGKPEGFVGIISGGGIEDSSRTDITSGETSSLSISIATISGNTEEHA